MPQPLHLQRVVVVVVVVVVYLLNINKMSLFSVSTRTKKFFVHKLYLCVCWPVCVVGSGPNRL